MKKSILTIIFASILATNIFASSTIPVYFDSKPIQFSKKPVIKEDILLLPFRDTFETMGYTIEWDSEINGSVGYNDTTTFIIKVNDNTAYINDEPIELLLPPQLIDSTLMVPYTFVTQVTGYSETWNNENRYMTIGETDQDLVDIYEQSSIVSSYGESIIRGEDLYTIDATGEYAGYKKIMGHPYTNYDAYFKIDGSITSHFTENIAPNDGYKTVTLILDGVPVQTTKEAAYKYFNLLSELGELNSYSIAELENTYGSIFTSWSNDFSDSINVSNLTENYVDYLSGVDFNYSYNRYKQLKLLEEASAQFALESKAQEEAAIAAEKEVNLYEEKRSEAYALYSNNWISKSHLNKYNDIYVWWNGYTIYLMDDYTNEKLLTLKNAPSSSFEKNKIYEYDGVRYQYIDTYTVPFALAEDGSGELKIDVNDIVFNKKDLIQKGILE